MGVAWGRWVVALGVALGRRVVALGRGVVAWG